MSVILNFFGCDNTSDIPLPFTDNGISAGFPSPAEDLLEHSLDLNKELIKNPASTFYARVSGCSMTDAGIDDGDLLIIDKLVEPFNGCVAVCYIDGEFTLKRVEFEKDYILLVPKNANYKPIKVTKDNDFMIWGVVRYSIKKF
ncbi:MAG: translesion error-prone DNA polymerase V autoproteolytic subunit [Rikenellaceae bacterium]